MPKEKKTAGRKGELAASGKRGCGGMLGKTARCPGSPQRHSGIVQGLAAFLCKNVLVLIVVAFCAMAAIWIGALSPEYGFQKTTALVFGECGKSPEAMSAFAGRNGLVVPVDGKNPGSSQASFSGSGTVLGVKLKGSALAGINISAAYANGQKLCGPCRLGKGYGIAVPAEGTLHLRVETVPAGQGQAEGSKPEKKFAFIDPLQCTFLQPYVEVETSGSWAAANNAKMPSTIYGVDAPFHSQRAGELAAYLGRLKWPSAQYTFVSAIPPALAVMAFGATPEYAYKLWQTALFLLPAAIFYLLSRKMARGKDAVFAISTLLYLAFPVSGLLTGGGPDLFLYGMTAHTLATQLSLVFFYFAYEYCAEKKRNSLLAAALFFMLAFLSNQRIIVALGFLAASAAIPAALRHDFRRVLLFAACLAASVLWQAIPFFTATNFGGYGALGGASIKQEGEWLMGMVQSGYVILPALFIIGVIESVRRKNLMPALLGSAAFMTLLFVSSPGVNRVFPFIDGLRFIPSFFLPAFFLAGVGGYAIWAAGFEAYAKLSKRHGWDQVAVGGGIALALFIPLAAVFFVSASTSLDFYRLQTGALQIASDHDSFAEAAGVVGNERALYLSGMQTTHYPMSMQKPEQFYFTNSGTPDGAAGEMERFRLRYLIIGPAKLTPYSMNGAPPPSRSEEYLAFAQDGRFAEVPMHGATKLFQLKTGEAGAEYFADGADISEYSIMEDRAEFSGFCGKENCSIAYFTGFAGKSACVNAGKPCGLSVDAGRRSATVSNLPQGAFDVRIEPENPDYFVPLALACVAVVCACHALSREN